MHGSLWQARQEVGVAVRASFAVLECVVEGGEELVPPLGSGIVVPALPMLSTALWSENMRKLVPERYRRRRLRAQTMRPASKSRGVQCLPESSVARLIYAMGFIEPSACSCSRGAPNPSMQPSQHTWNVRESSATTSQLWKTKNSGMASSAEVSRTNFSIAGVNTS